MKIFVIGPSKSGKTPVCAAISDILEMQYIKASEWVREEYSSSEPNREKFIENITNYSIARLKDNPSVCFDYISNKYDLSIPSIIDGSRNPHDFIKLFDIKNDIAIRLNYKNNDLARTQFEKGIDVIENYLDWLKNTDLIKSYQWKSYSFDRFYPCETKSIEETTLEEVIKSIKKDLVEIKNGTS